MEVAEAIRERYAIRSFRPEPIPEEKILELIDLIRLAPSALNLQPWRIKIVADKKKKEELAKYTVTPNQILTCSHLLVLCANTNIDEVIEAAFSAIKKAGHPRERTEGMKELIGRIKDRLDLSWAREQIFILLGVTLVAAKSLGLDSCPMTGFDPDHYRRELGLPPNIVPVALCALGYGAEKPLPRARLESKEIIIP